jgi:cation transport protein ChaC
MSCSKQWLGLIPTSTGYEQTRKRLAERSLLQTLRADPPPGVRVRTDAELEETLAAVLRRREPAHDLHVFGYGSLMWNPALDAVQTRVAQVGGWHRRFCFRLPFGRGTPQQPGATLALVRGGACRGLLFRIEAIKVAQELRLLWQREMLAGAYRARWVHARAGGRRIPALTFVADCTNERYLGALPIEHVVRLIRSGKGPLGATREYFESVLRALEHLGIRDRGIERLQRAVIRADADEA